MAIPVLQFKRGNAGVAGTVPALRPGEPGLSLNNFDFFIGIDTSVANNKFFGSHRYWGREDGTNALNLKLVDKDGTNYVAIKAPNTLGGNITYTFPGTQGASNSILSNDGSGNLSWASGSTNPVFAGIATFLGTTDNTLGNADTGAVQIDGGLGINKNVTVGTGLSVSGQSYFTGIGTFANSLAVGSGVTIGNGSVTATTFYGSVVGLASTATRATLVDTTTAPTGTFYPGLFVSNTGTASTAVYVDSGISYVSNTDTLTLTGDIAVNGGDVTTSATTFNLVNSTATGVNFAGAATSLVMGATTGIGTIRNTTISFPNATTVAVNGANPTISGTSTGTLTFFNTNLTGVNAFGAATSLVMGAATGITTVRNKLTVGGNLEIDGNIIQASDGNTNITLTSNTLTTFAGDIKVTGNDIQSSSATAITLSGTNVTVAGDLTVGGNDIKASDGTTALTLTNSTGAVTAASDLTVTGNLYVSGNTTQVNTTALTVEDRTIDLGIVNGAAPTSATTWDLGVLFNYYTAGSAKKSAVVWEHADTRFKFASVLSSDTDGSDNNTPQLTVTTFAPIEIGSLWANDCAGQSQVISCTGTTRNLENITIDGGTY